MARQTKSDLQTTLRLHTVPRLPPRPRARRRGLATAGLFAGVGGLELGLARAGHHTQLLCEIEPGARAVLAERFPGVIQHDDVTSLRTLPSGTELVVGGFPCQDLSQAGKTAGIDGARSGLVGEVFRLLDAQPVPNVLLENVPFMLHLAHGEAMGVIVSAFEARGYKWAYRVVDSRAFGVPQRRERVYFLAMLDGDPRDVLFADDVGDPRARQHSWSRAHGFYWTEGVRGLGWADDAVPTLKGGSTIGIPSPPAIVLPDGRVVTPHIRDAERMQGFAAGWTEPVERAMKARGGHRWKLVGNAVTVDAAEWLGRRLLDPNAAGAAVACEPLARPGAWPKAAFNVGSGPFVAHVSPWPERRERVSLQRFLQHPPALLSAKATAGFLRRTQQSTLRFPAGFLDRVQAHLSAVTGAYQPAQVAAG